MREMEARNKRRRDTEGAIKAVALLIWFSFSPHPVVHSRERCVETIFKLLQNCN